MIRLLGSNKRLCDGLTRRDCMHIGGLGFFGLGLSDALRLREAQASKPATPSSDSTFGRAKACILLLPYGSPPQHETFDPKPDAPVEIQGELGAIPTNLPGVNIGELLPRIATMMDRITVVRSMTHPYPVHCTAYVTSGIPDYSPALESRPRDPKLWPYIGSIVDYVDERSSGVVAPAVPRNMALPWQMNSRGGPVASAVTAGPYAAFLGPAYNPVLTDFEGEGSRTINKISPANGPTYRVDDPYAGVKPDCRFLLAGSESQASLAAERLQGRRSLLRQFEDARRRLEGVNADSFDRYRRLAFSLLGSPKVRDALDVRREPNPLRESYGMTLFGQACLAARRLVEAGTRFTTVFWDEYAYLNTDWDTHWNHFYRLKDRLLPGFDMAFSGLIRDLENRGMLDETLVVWMSEHGRTPKINSAKGGGRDHWSRAYSIALAGGGIAKGNVFGSSDTIASDVQSDPVSPKDILATVLHLLGIDPDTTIPNRIGQPMRVAGKGSVRPELFG